MILKDISLINFRSYENLSVEIPENGCLFLGENGSGKTNFLEALGIAATGKSVRDSNLREMVRIGEKEASISANFLEADTNISQIVGFSKNNDIFVKIDDIKYKNFSSLYGKNGFVYFGVDDIKIVKGNPLEKRQFFDYIISQTENIYLQRIIKYRNLIKQRNFILTNNFNLDLISIYDKQISELAIKIIEGRKKFFNEVIPLCIKIYGEISNKDLDINLQYIPSIDCESESEYFNILHENLQKDREIGFTTLGCHRDNFEFRAENIKLTNFASQGQCKSAAISFKMAAVEYLSKENKKTIIAVDDAFSDLDISRKRKFFDILEKKGQIFIAIHSRKELDYYDIEDYFEIKNGEMKCFRK